jgi:hypothetical protein
MTQKEVLNFKPAPRIEQISETSYRLTRQQRGRDAIPAPCLQRPFLVSRF